MSTRMLDKNNDYVVEERTRQMFKCKQCGSAFVAGPNEWRIINKSDNYDEECFETHGRLTYEVQCPVCNKILHGTQVY